MAAIHLSSPVAALYGIGPSAEEKLAKLGIETIYDLITYIPRRYNDWNNAGDFYDARDGMEITFRAHVATKPEVNVRSRTRPVSFYLSDGFKRIKVTFFNSSYIARKFAVGDECFVHGKVTMFAGKPQMVNPYIENASKINPDELVKPVYPLTEGVTSNNLSRWVRTALDLCGSELLNVIPQEVVQAEGFVAPSECYRMIHFPKDMAEADRARRQIAYEELILLGIGMKIAGSDSTVTEKAERVIPPPGSALNEDIKTRWNKIISNLGFKLTDDQAKAVREIQMDLMKDTPMNRLVQGDVGSGKTVVAILAMAMTALMGKQSVLLAPTSVLASQHYNTAVKLLEGSGINVVLLLGKTKQSVKKEIKEKMRQGEAAVIIGTHALLSDNVEFDDLALVIADEQHRFGVKQREKLLIKQGASGEVNSVHNLVMTATPIPRTLAMVLYGDMATSIIKQKPAGRQTIKTWFVDSRTSPDITEVLKSKLEAGEQAYIVCAKIDDEHMEPDDGYRMTPDVDESEIISVVQMKEMIDKTGLSGRYTTATLYGSMNEAAKLDVMERFVRGEVKILISTTVIEVGVDNPNANVMVIMDADRFGLSTLHQLRGRIGRGSSKSFCLLVSESRSELELQRIKMMCESSDGFELAQKDLELRGPGDFFGTRQHGIPSLRAANLYTDIAIASEACEAVNKVFEEKTEEASVLYNAIASMFELRFGRKMGSL